MTKNALLPNACLVVTLGLLGVAPAAWSSDAEELNLLLDEFLSAAHRPEAHERFWAEDLVYTSSSGLRFGKAEIMQGFSQDDADADNAPAVIYSGEDVAVRVYGTAAVVTFKLVGTPADSAASEDVAYYFNTGTFLKRDGAWKVVAWQATKIPPGN